MSTPNQNPESVFNFQVQFNTTNINNGNSFSEFYNVSQPTAFQTTFQIPFNFNIISPNKIAIPLQSQTGLGSFWIKLWLPQPSSNKMFITFCVKVNNSLYPDGFYDYKTGIPTNYRNALRTWILDNNLVAGGGGQQTFNKILQFFVHGTTTNNISESTQFLVRFSATFNNNIQQSTTPPAGLAGG